MFLWSEHVTLLACRMLFLFFCLMLCVPRRSPGSTDGPPVEFCCRRTPGLPYGPPGVRGQGAWLMLFLSFFGATLCVQRGRQKRLTDRRWKWTPRRAGRVVPAG